MTALTIKNANPANLADLLTVETLAWNSDGENISAESEKITQRIASFAAGVSVAHNEAGAIAGSQYAFCFDWSGKPDELTSWDDLTAQGWTNKVHVTGGNTGFLVGVGVIPTYRGTYFQHNLRWREKLKASELLIAFTLDNLFDAGVKQVIGNARVPAYYTKPDLVVENYCALRRDDGKLYDPVLRFHERMGGQVLKPVAYSMQDAESRNAGCWVLYEKRF